ncbi:MAG TPA: hypothetical protein PK511_09010 [Chitinophagales bacterium]|nr:hypothetical protein [Chitinophagales bacterium]HNE45963.1 hypothetical protein [Chitinophagales bacterium]HNF69995.1 hypothetical protein [Chitinophagales bacterium]HNI54646.1 hypothetical protein [Chitinophagales bacterium]HNJ88714.1 hypothetical protein [Chitinophagales bacterium]
METPIQSIPPIDRFEPGSFSTTKSRPFPPHVFVVVFIIVVGMFLNMTSPIPALLLAMVDFGLLSMRSGVEVLINAKSYSDFTSIYGIKFGKWKSLGEYDFILITRINKRRNAMMNIAYGVSYGDVFFDMDLITKGDRDVLLNRLGEREIVIDKAIQIGQYFDLRVVERVDGDYQVVFEPEKKVVK